MNRKSLKHTKTTKKTLIAFQPGPSSLTASKRSPFYSKKTHQLRDPLEALATENPSPDAIALRPEARLPSPFSGSSGAGRSALPKRLDGLELQDAADHQSPGEAGKSVFLFRGDHVRLRGGLGFYF